MSSSKMLRATRYLRPLVSIAAITLAIYYIAGALLRNWSAIKEESIRVNAYSIIAIGLFIIAVVVSGWLWGGILSRLSGKEVDRTESARVHIGSWLLKYVPGQVGSYAGKLAWGLRRQFSKKDVTVSFVYENLLLITTSVFVAVPILVFIALDKINSDLSLFVPLLLVIPIVALLYRPIFYWVLNTFLRLSRKKKVSQEYLLSERELIILHAKYLLPRIINAAGFILIVSTVASTQPSQWLGLGAAYVLAGVVGILVLFVPSGLGVREAVIILLLGSYFSIETATVIALLSRLYATIADLLLGVIYIALGRKKELV